MALLEIEGLTVEFGSVAAPLTAVDDVDLTIDAGEIVGCVGESGSGKSVTALALMGLVDFPGRVRARRMVFAGRELLSLSAAERRALTGKDIAMIFQDPLASLNPCFTVAFQLTETLRMHGTPRSAEAPDRAARGRWSCCSRSTSPIRAARLGAFPHQFSGGMAQRVMIAMAIACNPRLLIADEPTTALDVTVQAQVLDLLLRLQQERGMALLLITHDLGRRRRDRAARRRHVRRRTGRDGTGAGDLRHPAASVHARRCSTHCPSTTSIARGCRRFPASCPARTTVRPDACCRRAALLRCRVAAVEPAAARRAAGTQGALPFSRSMPPDGRPRLGRRGSRQRAPWPTSHERVAPLLEVRSADSPLRRLARRCFAHKAIVRALDGVSFSLRDGETLAVVGESGCGKSTLARQVTMIERRRRALSARRRATSRTPTRRCKRLRPRCRWCSRIRTRRSIRARRSGTLLEEPLAINAGTRRPRARAAARAMMAQGRIAPRALSPLSAHVLRRPAAADRGGARADARIRGWSSPTSRSRRSTCRSRPRC